MAVEQPLFTPMLTHYILAFISSSVMVRSTCHAFKRVAEDHEGKQKRRKTTAAEAATTVSLVRWAVINGLTPELAQTSCVRRGSLEGLRLLRSLYALPLHAGHAREAARRGRLNLLEWLRENGCPWDEHTCSGAAEGGHLEVLRWARANGCPWSQETTWAAAKGGHLEVLQWAAANGCPCDEETCRNAACGGHLAALQWLRARGCPWNELTCTFAADGGHLRVLQWARAHGCPWNEGTCARAAKRGHLDILQWARANGCPWGECTCEGAACGGHLRVLQWARANGCPWDALVCGWAAFGGHLHVLTWLRENGCPWHEDSCSSAAMGGHLEVLQWARANGCPWKEDTCSCAAGEGHLEVLQWARANGCPWDVHTIASASANTHHSLRAWQELASTVDFIVLYQLRCPPASVDAAKAVQAALQAALVQPSSRKSCPWFYDRGVVDDGSVLQALEPGRARTVLGQLAAEGFQLTIVAAVRGPAGLCCLGQRVAPRTGYETLAVHCRTSADEEKSDVLSTAADAVAGAAAAWLDAAFSGGGALPQPSMRVRALYEMWGAGDSSEGAAADAPTGALLCEWDCAGGRHRGVGDGPPATCRSQLIVGGRAMLSAACHTFRAGEQPPWQGHLQQLLSASADEAALSTFGDESAADNGSSAVTAGQGPDDSMLLDATLDIGFSRSAAPTKIAVRGDLDFSERLWEVAANMATGEEMAAALTQAAAAVRAGSLLPAIGTHNTTAVAGAIAACLRRAQEQQYGGRSQAATLSSKRSEAAVLDAGPAAALLEGRPPSATEAAALLVELGLHKVANDMRHWFTLEAALSTGDLHWHLNCHVGAVDDVGDVEEHWRSPLAPHYRVGAADNAGDVEQAIRRLSLAADAAEVVTLAAACSAPWQQTRALAQAALAAYRTPPPPAPPTITGAAAEAAQTPAPLPLPLFLVHLPEVLPQSVRARLSRPVFWELIAAAPGGSSSSSSAQVAVTQSHLVLERGLGGVRGGGGDGLHAALSAVPEELRAEVLACVLGADAAAKTRSTATNKLQLEVSDNAEEATEHVYEATEHVYVCTHRRVSAPAS
ncbi:hypothetical protein JKP88DRAFT_350445 [Tribonema minus]|uniref:Ankyrin repeat domain-containing protein n=1 Tax=Tribonema minus TaxID=303371 RepID=A0A836C9H3_9STRA|nr:hypothetical protein JKP88DRAFT_350445 [Tribonema minus]